MAAAEAKDASDFAPLKLLHLSRGAHGIRQQAFAKYSEFCARKVARARKQLGLVQQRGKRFERKDVAAAASPDYRHLVALLYDAERAWAQAQHLRAQLAARKVGRRARQHLLQRLKRAATRAETLARKTRETEALSASSVAQAEAYAATLRGLYAYEARKYADAAAALSAAHAVLDAVVECALDPDTQAYAYEAQDDVEPYLRASRDSLGATDAPPTSSPDTAVVDWPTLRERLAAEGAKAETRAEPVRLRWRDRVEDVRNANLAQAVARSQRALAALEAAESKPRRRKATGKRPSSAANLARFEAALTALTEAEDIAGRSLDDNQLALDKAHSLRFEAATAPLRFVHAYLRARVFAVRCQRDLLLARDARKAAVAVKLLDAALHGLEQLATVDLLIDDGDAAEAMEAKAVLVRGQRCMHLARAYSALKQHPKAALLAERAVLYATQARSGYVPTDDELDAALRPLALTDADAAQALRDAEQARAAIARAWFAAGGPDRDGAGAFGALQLDGRPKRHRPVFFDIAVNYVHPDLEEIARRAGKAPPQPAAAVDDGTAIVEPVKEAVVEPAKAKGWFGGIFGR